jgi:ArsR family transcriptional regulator, arsenate/arsenite/antimonite-responsive transcriptional repressor
MPKPKLAVVSRADSTPVETAPASFALAAFAALGQPTRLEVLRLLMRREPDGLAAGAIAEAIGCPQNTLSTHLSILARAGLVRGERDGRSIVYRASIAAVRDVVTFLTHDCCDGHPEICGLFEPASACGCTGSSCP